MASFRLDWHDTFPEACRRGAVAVGNFDGAHRGHAALIAETVRQARVVGGPAVAMTFDPHPLALLRPDRPPEMLTTAADRAACLLALGVDVVVTLVATPSLLELSAADFFARVLLGRLEARALVEGTNFGFGRQREGDVTLLARLCRAADIPLRVVPPVTIDGVEVSSSRIRAELRRGDVAAAARLLGRPYRLRGRVIEGQRRGRTIGYPTANLGDVTTLVPAGGVYAVVAQTTDGTSHAGR
ncbi:MAG: riboflavin kinase [Gemmataceae bacterium]